jgi:hypothetical protein
VAEAGAGGSEADRQPPIWWWCPLLETADKAARGGLRRRMGVRDKTQKPRVARGSSWSTGTTI